MSSASTLDVLFLLRQSAIIAVFAFIPLLAIVVASHSRKRVFPFALVCAFVGWVVLFTLLYQGVDRINQGQLPYQLSRPVVSQHAIEV